jgi:hypothetical protein
VRFGKLPPATGEVHLAIAIEPHLHILVTMVACLAHIHFTVINAVERQHEVLRKPQPLGTFKKADHDKLAEQHWRWQRRQLGGIHPGHFHGHAHDRER